MLKECLYERLHRSCIWKRWGIGGNSQENGKLVYQKATKQALCSTPVSMRHQLIEQGSGMCGVEKMMKLWGKWKLDVFRRCGEKEMMACVLAC